MIRSTSLALVSTLLLSTAALAMDRTDNLPNKGTVTISGEVAKISDKDEFDLAYDGGMIHVDTNAAWPNIFHKDANNATKQLAVGDHVVVTGKIDNNFFSKREIEAHSLSFENGGQIFSYEHNKDKDSMNVSR
jgi:hypothetical protein